ncbi:MAG: hypothetical protein Q7S87_08605 [Agitococcus sp.]|nr:hypothetical protein [Agitococcus sp.]MDO9177630.1 hypothetical protein [Agitococcus sp.]
MEKPFYSVLFEDCFDGGHYILISAAGSVLEARLDAQVHLEQVLRHRPTFLGIFRGVLEQLAPTAAFNEHPPILTLSAQVQDRDNAERLLTACSAKSVSKNCVEVLCPMAGAAAITLVFVRVGHVWIATRSDKTETARYLLLTQAVREQFQQMAALYEASRSKIEALEV